MPVHVIHILIMQSRSKEENNEIDNLFEIYDKVMHLNIFITSSDQDLKNKYLEAAKIHNQKIKYQSDYIDAGFDLFAPEDSPVSLQYRIMKKLYLTPSFNYGAFSDRLSPFNDNVNIIGYGLNLGYESILGPINVNVSKNDFLNLWRVYFSIGFKF